MKKLIVTAHDYGLCNSVNRGIEYTLQHENNIIQEVSLLPNAPCSDDAAKYIKENNIEASLCINLTTFKPLSSDVDTLTDSAGNFKSVDISTWNFSIIDTFDEEEVSKEINAQYDWFVKSTGKKPNSLHSRKNEIGDPKVLIPTVALASKENIAMRTPIWEWAANYGAQSYVTQSGVHSSKGVFTGLKDWKGRWGYNLETELQKLVEDINAESEISELLLFPGFVGKDLINISSVNWQRGQIVQLIHKGDIVKRIKSNFELVSFKDL